MGNQTRVKIQSETMNPVQSPSSRPLTDGHLRSGLVLLASVLFLGCGAPQPIEKGMSVTPKDARAPVSGFCDFGHLTQRLKAQESKLQPCYKDALKRDAALKGTVKVHFFILLNGKVEHRGGLKWSTRIIKSDILDASFQACLIKAVNTFTFDKPKGGICNIRKTFKFPDKAHE